LDILNMGSSLAFFVGGLSPWRRAGLLPRVLICGIVHAVSPRDEFNRKLTELIGARVHHVEYWDVHNFGGASREWDFDDWHHAVMGVQIETSSGPVSLLWTNTFYDYGIEVFNEPITTFFVLSDEGPERWTVTNHPEWKLRTGHQVLAVDAHWERHEIGPARTSDGRIVEPARTVEIPLAIRLDFAAGPVWFVAGIPKEGDVFLGGDEVMVVFTSGAMLRLGFPAGSFSC
jgi:hypothetical protein